MSHEVGYTPAAGSFAWRVSDDLSADFARWYPGFAALD